jgi:signal transduction histidine kinase
MAAKMNSDNGIETSIKDNGIGMSQHMIDNLFRIDVQTVKKDTEDELSNGLGLLLCKEFIEKHGGKMWVESIVRVGTTFNFSIPLSLENVRSTNVFKK